MRLFKAFLIIILLLLLTFLFSKKEEVNNSINQIKDSSFESILSGNVVKKDESYNSHKTKSQKGKQQNFKKEILTNFIETPNDIVIETNTTEPVSKIDETQEKSVARFLNLFTFINYTHSQYSEATQAEAIISNLNIEQDVELQITKEIKSKNKIKADIHSFDKNLKFLDLDTELVFNSVHLNSLDIGFNLGGFYSNSYMPTNKIGFDNLWGVATGITFSHFIHNEPAGELSLDLGFPLSARDKFNLNTTSRCSLGFKYPMGEQVLFKIEYQVDKFISQEVSVNYNRFWAGFGFSW